VFTDRVLAQLRDDRAVRIRVTSHQWWWDARYGGAEAAEMFTTANELHIPVGRPVVLTLESADVIHSFWVPALSGKKDLIPGRTATLRLQADRPGVYRGQCAEFCGTQHAKMALLIVAEPEDDFQRWATRQRQPAREPTDDLQRRGRDVFQQASCAMCHAIHGTRAGGRRAPDLTHLASRRTIAAGTLPNSVGNLAGWIVDPHRIKPGVNMPANALSPDDLHALLAFLRALE
jgi:cytochrome c oxidase subunit 2